MRHLLPRVFLLAAFAALPVFPGAAAPLLPTGTTLLLVELRGGIDGLDTIIPYRDPAYPRLRPTLAVAPDKVLPLDDALGLHPSLAPLLDAWKARQLALVMGVGYPQQDFSHFRSIDIWETGSGSDKVLSQGWIADAFSEGARPPGWFADGVVIGDLRAGPLAGPGMKVLGIDDPRQFVAQSGSLGDAACADVGDEIPALTHLLEVQAQTQAAAVTLQKVLPKKPTLVTSFPSTPIGRQAGTAASLLEAGLSIPVIKLTLNGFDTHVNEKARQEGLLADLAAALSAFRTEMIAKGMWDKVLVMTYSEFGRRAQENANQGTDHGTAEPIFVMGGTVNGDIYGSQPSLTDLDNGNLRPTTDYRSVYETVDVRWWGLPGASLPGGPWPLLPFLGPTNPSAGE